MQRNRRHTLAALSLLVIPAIAALTGCAAIDELAHKQRTAQFATTAELADDPAGAIAWLPADATDILLVHSTIDDTASVLATSSSALDPALCAEVERQSAPSYSIPGAPDAYAVDHLFACGEWSVTQSENGWFGWTPNDPDEAAQSPSNE